MKSMVLRIFPSWCVILVIKFLLGIPYTFISWVETVLVAFVWASIHGVLGNRSSMRVISGAGAVFVIGTAITIFYNPCPWISKIIAIAIGGYMLKVSLDVAGEINLRNSDNNKSDVPVIGNVFGVKVIMFYREALEKIVEKGAKELGVNRKFGYQGDSPLFKDAFYKIGDRGYEMYRIAPDKTIVYGRDGLVIVRTIDEAGDYEFKDGKWYKDGKKCTNFNKEANKLLSMLSGERGTNKVILVKTFEGGSVKGVGCGLFITDITRGDQKLIEAVSKVTRVENYSKNSHKKALRIQRALGIW